MKTNRSYLMIVLLLFVASLAACTRDLPAPKTQEPKAAQPTEQPTEMIDTIYEFATQTAIALEQPLPATPGPEVAPTEVAPVDTQVVVIEPTPIPPVAPTLVVPASYTLQKDEFVYCIARRFNVNPNELLALNGMNLSSGQLVTPGRVLQIPQTGNPFPAQRALRPHPTSYTVVAGDSIYKIACLFGDVDPMAIAAVNGLVAPYDLALGQVLNIP